MTRTILFIVVSVANIIVSWPSLRNPRAYGFPRFFAFEATLSVILINIDYWFEDPFTPRQLLSWVFLCASGFLVVHGVYLLRSAGRPVQGFEDTTQMVQT